MVTRINVGDSVIVEKNYDNTILVGKIGKVVWCSNSAVSVEFDFRFNGGHRGNRSAGKEGYCWNFPNSYVSLCNKYVVELI